MAVAQGPFLAAVLLLVSLGLHCSSPQPACPEPCTCQRPPLLNCSSSGLSSVPQHMQDSVAEIDLSHNLLDSATFDKPYQNLRSVWLGNNSITRLSLCIERNLVGRYVRGRHQHRLRPWSRRGCISWAPTLQLLSVERNQLEQLPEGLEGSESLQILRLSFNRISTLHPGYISHLWQLKELHLQHNLITSLHPQMFQDLDQLQVLDLSFNMLTSLHPLTYLSLRNIGADVRLGGNRWNCDCSMRSLRRWMAYDSSRGLQALSMVCASPSILADRDLLQLEEDDLNCFSTENRPEIHQDVTVYSGSEIMLSCSSQDSMSWTPHGQASVSQPQAGLLISDITERDTGLYVCVSEENKVVSVFNLQISKIGGATRKTRSLTRTGQQIIPQGTPNRIGQERNLGTTQSDLTLAVCLSVFITFLIAFILGVVARPCIDVLWRRITKKKSSPEANSASTAGQRQYDNEAYSSGEEPGQIGTHKERRVTHRAVELQQNSNVQYYDTVASGDQESIDNNVVIECEVAQVERVLRTAGDSGSENSLRQSTSKENQKDLSGATGRIHNIEYENIPDPVELEKRRSLSSCSDSSLSDKVCNEDQMNQRNPTTPRFPQLATDSVQQRADFLTARKEEVPQISIESSENPEFSSEPFADWSPHRMKTNITDPDLWQENEEQFEFSDSVRSTSARSSSVFGSFNDSKLTVGPTSGKQKRDDMSSSSSSDSGHEPTDYTVNSDQDKEEAFLKQDDNFQLQIHGVDPILPSVAVGAVRPKHSFSSSSSESDGKDQQETEGKDKSICVSDKLNSRMVTEESDTREKVVPMPRTKWRIPILGVRASQSMSLDTRPPSPPAAYSSSSSSESEVDTTDLKVEQNTGRINEGIKINEPETLSTDLDHQYIPQIKSRSDINTPSPASDSTSSDESTDETTNHTKRQEQGGEHMAGLPIKDYESVSNNAMQPQWPSVDLGNVTPIKRRVDIRAQSPAADSSSSSESADESMDQTQKLREPRLQFKESQTPSRGSDKRWPALDLEHIPHVKRHLDIKAPSPASESSSSSDSEDETTHHPQRTRKVDTAELAFQKSQSVSHKPDTSWPALDLKNIPRVKRHLDIKAPSPASESSSSSDSEDETTHHPQRTRKVDTAELAFQKSQAVSHSPVTIWPALDLKNIPHVKRHLDIKAPSPASDSSSSSDSEDETTHHIQRAEKVDTAELAFQKSQAVSHSPDTSLPALDLKNIPRVKRHLDIKATSLGSDSSSSSDSEDGLTGRTEKQEQGHMHMASPSIKVSHEPQTQWPVLDLEHTTPIKRHLDIKAPSPASESSSSSDSEDETTHHTQRPGKVDTAELAFQKSQAVSHSPDTSWPALDLKNIPHVKKHLDIKAPSPASESSSSSDSSEDETTDHTKKERTQLLVIAGIPFKESKTLRHDPETGWPAVDLDNITRLKRHLDIKAPSTFPDSLLSGGSMNQRVEGKQEEAIKISPHYSSSSSSDEQEEGMKNLRNPPTTGERDPDSRWPQLDLSSTLPVKRRLDIRAHSPPPESSSSSDESEGGATDLPLKMERDRADVAISKLPDLNMSVPLVKRHLNIKAPVQQAVSCSSDSDNESQLSSHTVKQGREKGNVGITNHEEHTKLQKLSLNVPYINRRMDFKAPSPQPDPILSSVSPGSQQSESNSSRSSSEDENGEHAKPGLKVSPIPKATEKEFMGSLKTPLIHTSHSPKTDPNIKLEKYTVITDDIEDKTTTDNINTTQAINPKPELRWAAMNLGISRFRKRLEITSDKHEPTNLPSSSPPDSPSSSSSESGTGSKHSRTRRKRRGAGMQEIIHTGSSLTPENKPVNFSLSLKGRDDNSGNYSLLKTEGKSNPDTMLTGFGTRQLPDSSSSSENEDASTEYASKGWKERAHLPVFTDKEASQTHASLYVTQAVNDKSDSVWPHLSHTNTPDIRTAMDVTAPLQREASSSSSSENETIDHNVPGLSLGVPHVDRRSHYKAPLSESSNSSSSSSENEDEVIGHTTRHASDTTGMTYNDSLIAYKRTIFKPPLPPKNFLSQSGPTVNQTNQRPTRTEMVTAAQRGPSHSVGGSSESLASKSPSISFDDAIKKRIKQSRGTTDVDFPPKFSSLSANSVSLASNRGLDKLDNSLSSTNEILRAVPEDREERRGLSALKAMSLERQKWDPTAKNLEKGASPLFNDNGPQVGASFYNRRSEDIKPLAKQPQTQSHFSSTAVGEREATDLLYGIPRYRRHDIGGIEPLQEAPPPIPATPLPDEAAGLTWRSPQSSKKQGLQGTRFHTEQSRNTENSDPSSITSQNEAAYF